MAGVRRVLVAGVNGLGCSGMRDVLDEYRVIEGERRRKRMEL
jgi:predicted RNA-binding protein